MSGLSLYVIADEFLAGLNALSELDLDPQTLADTIEGMSGDIETKSLNVAMFIRNCEATIVAMKAAEEQMAKRRKTAQTKVDGLQEYVKTNMERCGIKKFEGPMFTISVRTNPGAVMVIAPDMVPQCFWRTPTPPPPPEPTIDKAAIKAAIAAGGEVPGAYVEKGTRLEIK